MNEREKLLVAQAKANALELENAQLRASVATNESAALQAVIDAGKIKSQSERNYAAFIRRRAARLVADGKVYESLILLKSIGE